MQVQKPLARTAHNSLRRGDIPQTGHWFGQKRVKSKLTLRCGLPQQSRRGQSDPLTRLSEWLLSIGHRFGGGIFLTAEFDPITQLAYSFVGFLTTRLPNILDRHWVLLLCST
jgi:hypothetical protein